MSARNGLAGHPVFMALLAGGLLPLAFAPFGFFPLAVLAPLILFRICRAHAPAVAARAGFVFGLGFFGVGVSWVYVAFHDFGNTPLVLSALMTALFVAVLALYPALQCALGAWLLRRFRVSFLAANLLFLPALWMLFEWLRGWLFTGFPWLLLGYSQSDSPLAGYAPLLGVYGLSLLLAISAGLLLVWREAVARAQNGWWFPAALVLIWGGGAGLGQIAWTQATGKPVRVSLVQGNVPQITKWDPAMIQARLDTYARLTREHWDSDLIVWPENAMTTFFNDLQISYFQPLMQEAAEHGTSLIIGAPVMDADGVRYYSSLISLTEPPVIYNKRHLVPFGEFIPLQAWLRGIIGFLDLPMSGFSRGERDQPPLPAAGVLLAPSICYEDAFGEELIDFLPQSGLLVNGSNNAWYGNSFAPHQHLQISRLRALESGRDLLRATTNGISAIVDYRGRIMGRSPQFEESVISATVQPRAGATPYVRFGNGPVVLLSLLMLGAGLRRHKNLD